MGYINKRDKFRNRINSCSVGDIIRDDLFVMGGTYNIYSNALIKLGYTKRIGMYDIEILKHISEEHYDYNDLIEAAKGIPLPKVQMNNVWGLIHNTINNLSLDSKYSLWHNNVEKYMGLWSSPTRGHLKTLERLGYIEIIEYGRDFDRKYTVIKKKKQIPENLTSSLAKKYLYKPEYKRAFKIKVIKERINKDV